MQLDSLKVIANKLLNHLGKALCIEFGVVALDSLMPWSKSVLAEIMAARMADGPIIDIDPSAFCDDEE